MQTLSQYHVDQTDIRKLYHQLQHTPHQHLHAARHFLQDQLQQCAVLSPDLPSDPGQLQSHVLGSSAGTARAWRDYLLTRKQGQPRRYFSNRAHALYFLRNVAPTKLVDGAWLYGTLKHQQDPRMHDLIRTYLEELGDGEPEQNHVILYKQLLARLDIQDHDDLPCDRFIQGAIQLALGHLADEFLPEVIGYNLGYEQLPLHLLITTHELTELGIDPHYFRLHITIDNASTGHARRAARAVLENLPHGDHQHSFYKRVCRGYLLNELGSSSNAVIEEFNLDKELCRVLEEKSRIARHMHSDRCHIEGRTINEWLDSHGQIPDLLAALQRHGWIRRHQAPEKSRFWRLVTSTRAPMLGVFSGYELQLLHDWITGEWQCERTIRTIGPDSSTQGISDPASRALQRQEEIDLHNTLGSLPEEQRYPHVLELMSPARHFTPSGLAATRLFARQL